MARERKVKVGEARSIRAALYARVSTEDQASNGVSLEVQEERLRAHCESKGWQVARVYLEYGASGKTFDRPKFKKLLAGAKAREFEAVCVHKLDRLTRSVRDLGRLLEFFDKQKITLASVTESIDASSPAGRLVTNVLVSVAQWEREAIAERTAQALRHKRDRLVPYGPTPYGFELRGDRLVRSEKELDIVRRIYRLRRRGQPLATIAEKLNREKIPTKRGRKWAPATVHYVLRNDLYQRFLGK